MCKPDLWARVKAARIVPVFFVFLGASWGVLQVVDKVRIGLELPTWVSPASFVLLGIGLFVILATAWVQALPSTAEREKSGEVPGDWELAPRDLVGCLASGSVPHLTWGRSILGGVLALGLMFALAGLAVLFQGPLITPAQPEPTSEEKIEAPELTAPTSCAERD